MISTYSTETALLKVHHDIAEALDRKCMAALVLLDLFPAFVVIEDNCLNFGVPQGSALGPHKHCLYSKPIGAICTRHNLLYHCYADDTHVYMAIKPKTTWADVAKKLEACLAIPVLG